MKTQVHKISLKLKADPSRVITLPSIYPGSHRVKNVYNRVRYLSEFQTHNILVELDEQFGHRHKNIEDIYLKNLAFFKEELKPFAKLPAKKNLVLGAMLTKEFSIQSAALFNPSMVPHPDQTGLAEKEKRFIISLRSTGEGHISSIEFRSGVVDAKGNLMLGKSSRFALTGELENLPGKSDYNLNFPDNSELSERVIFPQSETEVAGMEDLRLVLFNDEGRQTYFGTYTAYDGRTIRSQILETNDFKNFKIRALTGSSAQDKGMAVFPEKINGQYAIISRQGGENISIMFSDDLYHWRNHQLLMEPEYPFEFSQIGNCGSPIKTDQGWLLLTHGVGPMRHYTISAALLDIADPTKVTARLDRPLITANEEEREGYVPNVVYTCGGTLHHDLLYIPYAMSDSMTGFAWVDINELLTELTQK